MIKKWDNGERYILGSLIICTVCKEEMDKVCGKYSRELISIEDFGENS